MYGMARMELSDSRALSACGAKSRRDSSLGVVLKSLILSSLASKVILGK